VAHHLVLLYLGSWHDLTQILHNEFGEEIQFLNILFFKMESSKFIN
jgi:hypothetical protein